jgi:hypothetical protein
MKKAKNVTLQFALCLNNEGYLASLEMGKLFRIIPDDEAAAHGYLRIIDESVEDYAFAASRFHVVDLPLPVGKALMAASHHSVMPHHRVPHTGHRPINDTQEDSRTAAALTAMFRTPR